MSRASLGVGMLAALLAAPVSLAAADPFGGAAVNVWQVSPVDASAARVQALAQALGLSGSPVETDISFLVSGPPDANGHPAARLILHKASGAVEYFNSAAEPKPGVKPQLLAAPDALKVATALVDKLGLMPANATTTTTEIEGVDSTGAAYGAMLSVVFSPQLAIAGTDQAPILTPIDYGDVTVDLGDGGAVIALTSFWRPVQTAQTAAQRGETAAWQDFALEEPSLNPAQPNVTVTAHYFAYPPDEVQPFYDPLYVALDGGGNIMAAAPATDFTPRLASLLPDGSTPVDGSRPVQLSAAAEAGAQPYRFSWEIAHGGALGEGASIIASLPNGPQAIGLTIRDARGAGYRVWETIQIANSTVRPRFGEYTPQRGLSLISRAWAQTNPLTWSTPGVQQVSGPNGTNFDAELPAGQSRGPRGKGPAR